MKQKYHKPEFKTKRVKLNLFMSFSRFRDSYDLQAGLIGPAFAACPPSCGCFLPGTKVILASGREKNIEKVTNNDIVLSLDTKTKQIVENKVEKLQKHEGLHDKYFLINQKIKVTGNHRVWVQNQGWRRVDELKLGDILLGVDAEAIIVRNLELKDGTQPVYNLHLKQSPHSYFASGVLAHNGDPWATAEKEP